MNKKGKNGRRYSPQGKATAVRIGRALRVGLGRDQGTAQLVALKRVDLMESVRAWVRQADIDEGVDNGVSSKGKAAIRRLEQELLEMKRERDPKCSREILWGGARAPKP